MQLKISLSAAESQLAAVRQEARVTEAALAEAQQQVQAAQEAAAAAETAAAELTAAEADLRACDAQLAVHRVAAADADAALGRAQADLASKQQLLSSLASSGDGSSNSESALAALYKEQSRLAVMAADLQAAATTAAADLAAAADRLAAAEDQLALAALSADWESQLAGRQGEAAAAAEALAARQAKLAEASEAAAARQQAAETAGAEVAAAERALADAEAEAAVLQSASEQLAAEQSELEGQLGALLAEVPELQMALRAAPASAAVSIQSVAAARRKCGQLARQRQSVLDEQRSSSVSRLPIAEQLRMHEQQAALCAARQQAATLATAAQCLQEGIASSNPQVWLKGVHNSGQAVSWCV